VQDIFVVDNGSTDDTVKKAKLAGAKVIIEPRRGYGAACLAGARAARNSDVIVFLDGDRSDDPRQLNAIAAPLIQGHADLVIGSRIGGVLEKGAMPLHGRLGNRLIAWLLRLLYGVHITDIGSFRAIKSSTLFSLNMEQMTYGWPVEMVVKAARKGLRIQSVPINYRKRIGKSKVTGTLKGTILATYYMFLVPLKYLFKKG
jgi:glycosyltransferase involved in cell wall biosynthesis